MKKYLDMREKIKQFKRWLLRKLWFWWINEDNGRYLRGSGKLEEIEKLL